MTKTRQWYYDGAAIGGATGKTHVLTSGQTDQRLIECRTQVDYGADIVAALAGYLSNAEITFTPGTYTRPADGNNPSINNTGIGTTDTIGPYYLDLLTVENGVTPSQSDMDAGSGSGVLEKVTLGPQSDIADLDGDLELSVSITNGRIYQQYRDSTPGTPVKSALTSTPTEDAINADAVAPTFVSANVDTEGDLLTVVFSKAVFGTSIPAAFTISGVSAGTPTLGAVSGIGTDTLTMAVSGNLPVFGDTLTLAYDDGTGDLANLDSEEVIDFTGQSVTNNVPDAGGFAWADLATPERTSHRSYIIGDSAVSLLYQERTAPTTPADADGDQIGTVTDEISGFDAVADSFDSRRASLVIAGADERAAFAGDDMYLIGGTLAGDYAAVIAGRFNGDNDKAAHDQRILMTPNGGTDGLFVSINDSSSAGTGPFYFRIMAGGFSHTVFTAQAIAPGDDFIAIYDNNGAADGDGNFWLSLNGGAFVNLGSYVDARGDGTSQLWSQRQWRPNIDFRAVALFSAPGLNATEIANIKAHIEGLY